VGCVWRGVWAFANSPTYSQQWRVKRYWHTVGGAGGGRGGRVRSSRFPTAVTVLCPQLVGIDYRFPQPHQPFWDGFALSGPPYVLSLLKLTVMRSSQGSVHSAAHPLLVLLRAAAAVPVRAAAPARAAPPRPPAFPTAATSPPGIDFTPTPPGIGFEGKGAGTGTRSLAPDPGRGATPATPIAVLDARLPASASCLPATLSVTVVVAAGPAALTCGKPISGSVWSNGARCDPVATPWQRRLRRHRWRAWEVWRAASKRGHPIWQLFRRAVGAGAGLP